MNTKDVLKIIRAARKVGLEYVKLDGIEMRFFPGDAEERKVIRVESQRPLNNQTELELVRKEHDLDQIEEDLASMQIEDPARFEEMLVERDIELGGREEVVND